MKRGLIIILLSMIVVLSSCDTQEVKDPVIPADCDESETLDNGQCKIKEIVDPVCTDDEILENHICVAPPLSCDDDEVEEDGVCMYNQSLCPNNTMSYSLTNLNYYGVDNTMLQVLNETDNSIEEMISIYESVEDYIFGELYYNADQIDEIGDEYSKYFDLENPDHLTDLEHRFYPDDTIVNDSLDYFGYGSDYYRVNLIFDIIGKLLSMESYYVEGTTVEIMHSNYHTVPSDEAPYAVTMFFEEDFININLVYEYNSHFFESEFDVVYRFYANENKFIFDYSESQMGSKVRSYDYTITDYGVETISFRHYNDTFFNAPNEGYVIESTNYITQEFMQVTYSEKWNFDIAVSARISNLEEGYSAYIYEGQGYSTKHFSIYDDNVLMVSQRERYYDGEVDEMSTLIEYNAKYLSGWDYYYNGDMYKDDIKVNFDDFFGVISLRDFNLQYDYYLSITNRYDVEGDIGEQFTNLSNGLSFTGISYDDYIYYKDEKIDYLLSNTYSTKSNIVLDGQEYSVNCDERVYGDPYVPEEYWASYVILFGDNK